MNGTEMIKLAGQARPDAMEKIAAAIAYLEKKNPTYARELVQELNEVADYAAEKIAMSTGGKWALGVAGAATAGLAGSIMTDLYDAAKRKMTQQTRYNEILKLNPELKKSFDKDRLQRSFDAIHRYAPEMTADPTVGGSLLKAVAEFPGNEHVVIKDLINARKSLADAKTTQYRMGPAPQIDFDDGGVADRKHQSRMEKLKARRAVQLEGYRAELRDAAERNKDPARRSSYPSSLVPKPKI